jgi:hypothetical protein
MYTENGDLSNTKSNFADDSMLVKINAYIKTTDFLEYLKISEGLNLGIMNILRTEDVRLALPANAICLENSDSGESL